ncbi:hypothetical protein RND71_007105 [Anisodus tanguticus]|uniref:Gfo/Idh/MocA-like oxidoreductase N-terminal domain-containing protein n=1 Tax=Anisodus tanguticus TaxID=243964 RepID=A0AAE1SN27_9SOLA|nr:hypothetical protein RND71_007105 [Anisodus tanguticus]
MAQPQPPHIAILGAGIFVKTQYIPRLAEIPHHFVLRTIWSRTELRIGFFVEMKNLLHLFVDFSAGGHSSSRRNSILQKWVRSLGMIKVAAFCSLVVVLSLTERESARSAVEVAQRHFPDVECKWGDAGLEEIIKDSSITGVAVVLAGQTMVDMSLRLLKAGKHVLQAVDEAEKALAQYNSLSATLTHQPIWAVAENYRFEPAFIESKKLISEIGEMMNIQVIVEGSMNSSNPYFASSWRRQFVVPDSKFFCVVLSTLEAFGGFILDMGVHFVAGLRMLVGCEIASLTSMNSHVDKTLPPPDNISSLFQLENGCSGVFVMVIIWRVVGLNGVLQVERGHKDGKHGYSVSLHMSDGQSKSFFYPFSGVTDELKTFLSYVSTANLKKDHSSHIDSRLSFAEGARDVAVLDAMLESGMRQGTLVQVKKL